jgi:RHS repeat-associated protein
MGYTGHFQHLPSGLAMPLYRAYDASLARWLSRDPLGESTSAQLFAYAAGSAGVLQPNRAGYQPGLQPFGFNSGTYRPGTGLGTLGALNHSTAVGWMGLINPLGHFANQANPYGYVENDPIGSRDSFGLAPASLALGSAILSTAVGGVSSDSVPGAAGYAIATTVLGALEARSAYAAAEAAALAAGQSSAAAYTAYGESLLSTYASAAGMPGAVSLSSVVGAMGAAAVSFYFFSTASASFGCGN